MKNNPFVMLAFLIILVGVGIAFTVWVICTPNLPLWVKLLMLK